MSFSLALSFFLSFLLSVLLLSTYIHFYNELRPYEIYHHAHSQLVTISEPIVSRGWRSCGQMDGLASPFLVPPRHTDLLSYESSPSVKSTTGEGYQSREFVVDFGASILAACPLGPMHFQHEEVDEVFSPLRASVNPRKRSLDLGEEEDERDTKLRRLSSMPQVQDFGASILEARPLGRYQSRTRGGGHCLLVSSFFHEPPEARPIVRSGRRRVSPTFEFSFVPSTQPEPPSLSTPAAFEGDSLQASPPRTPPQLEPTEQVETPVRAPLPGTPPLPVPTNNVDTLGQTQHSDTPPTIQPTTHPQDDEAHSNV